MVRKKIDSRIRTLVENCVKLRQRGLFVLVGDKGRDQVVNLHYMLSKTVVKQRPSVLWCYKKDLYLSSHRKKRMNQIKKMAQRGLLDPEKEDPFSLFVASTQIRYCYYADTHKILGQTFGMCVLQDFEALTPNLLARTIETVEGGGLVVLLLSTMSSLKQLFSLTMDVHSRLRTEAHAQVTGRFNERLVLSLASNSNCILMDDELNILPTSTAIKSIAPVPVDEEGKPVHDPTREAKKELAELVGTLRETQPVGPLVGACRSLDQARAVVTFLDAASEKTLRSTVALTAARGRGKSAAMGIAVSGAVALGYSNVFVTAPSPENLGTLFEFVFKGLDALGYKEHIDYSLVESTNPEFAKAIVRVNIFRHHRQTIQYIQPQHHAKLSQAELVVIDEAAAIPLPLVKAMLGPYLVFMGSTVNGYEGTGRSLSLKLIAQLREQSAASAGSASEGGSARVLREVTLQEPIRYAMGCPVEGWLHDVLCLAAADRVPAAPARLPHPDECELYAISRDTLFSAHRASEEFLQRMVSLYVASHYKNAPNDLLLMADAPAHRLFALLAPVDETANAMPDILAVVQVALEGAISRSAAKNALKAGTAPQGDLIPWTFSQQFQDPDFPGLSGARIVRIATHPELQRGGYGGRCVELLRRYYSGEITDMRDDDDEDAMVAAERRASPAAASTSGADLLSERLAPRTDLPPLLVALSDRPAERLHYLGVSYGLTQGLYNFWSRAGFSPVYLRQTPSEVTGEHTVVMVSPLSSSDVADTKWISPFVTDFRGRFIGLLAAAFREMPVATALSILAPKLSHTEAETAAALADDTFSLPKADGSPLSAHDLRRLQAYANNLCDHHMVGDLVPPLARALFGGGLPVSLSHTQAAILLVVGLQQRSITDAQTALNLPSNQVLALFNKAMRKLHAHLAATKEAAIERTLPAAIPKKMTPHAKDLEEDLDEAAMEVQERMKAQLDPDDLARYAIRGSDADFEAAVGGKAISGGLVSVKGGGAEKGAGAGEGMLYEKKKKKKGGQTPGKRKGGAKTPGKTPKKSKA